MATDLEKLVVQLSADIKGYEREMRKAVGVTNRQARDIESRFRSMNRNLDGIGRSAARSLVAPLAGIAATLSTREVMRYADAWTTAKNSLAVAGVVGAQQVQVLDRLYESAQANAAPLTAMADLFGRAAQASDNLGASQEELLRFSNGVGVALRVAGSSAGQASGALTQLGQLLGQARVQAEEFNSINEGARPILLAVAAGLDEAGGSVSKLKELVNDGKVSGQQFFQAFLRGLPQIEKMAANATQTIEQGVTKVSNAFMKYIGQTDESLGASQRLVEGLNALADNFENIADITVKVAAIIGAGLLGRSIAGMVTSLGLGVVAATRFIAAMRAAASMAGVASAISGVAVAAGPIGAVVGVAAAGALMLFARASEEADSSASRVSARIDELATSAEQLTATAERVSAAQERMAATDALNRMAADAANAEREMGNMEEGVLDLVDAILQGSGLEVLPPDIAAKLEDFRDKVEDGTASSEDFYSAIEALSSLNTSSFFGPLISGLSRAVSEFYAAADAADEFRSAHAAALAQSSSPLTPRQSDAYAQYGASRRAGDEMLRQGQEYLDTLQKQNALTQEQIDLNRTADRIRKDAPSGAILSDDQINAAARAELAANEARRSSRGSRRSGGGGSSGGGSSGQSEPGLFEDVGRDLLQLEREISLVGKTTGEVAKYRAQWALLDEVKKRGIPVTDTLNQQIETQSSEVGRLASELERAEISQQNFELAVDGVADALAGALVAGESLRDGLAQVMKQIASDIISSGIRSALMGQLGGGGMFSGLLGSVFGGIFGGGDALTGALRGAGLPARANGGPVSAGRAYMVGERGPEPFIPSVNGRVLSVQQAQDALRGRTASGRVEVVLHAPPGFSAEQMAEVEGVSLRVVQSAAPQIVGRSVSATQQSMRKSKAGWGI